MKKVFVLLIAIVLINISSAATLEIGEKYQPKETIIGEISGNIAEQINQEQATLKRNNVDIAFEYEIKNLGGKYFIWLVAPENPGNYTLSVENVISVSGSGTQSQNLQKNFNVEGNVSDYTLKPGVVFAVDDFKITVIVNGDFGQTINVDFPQSREINLIPGENKINFDVGGVSETGIIMIGVGKYSIPAYVIGQEQPENNGSNGNNNLSNENNSGEDEQNGTGFEGISQSHFKFGSSVIKSIIPSGIPLPVFKFEIINLGNSEIINPNFNYNKERFEIFPEIGVRIAPNKSFVYNLSLKGERQNFRDAIIAYSDNFSDYFLVIINFTSSGENVSTNYFSKDEGRSFFYCSELGGKICGEGESCSESEISSLDGKCCLAQCGAKSNGVSSWLGYLIAALLIGVLVFIFIKYRKTKQNKDAGVKSRFISAERNLP